MRLRQSQVGPYQSTGCYLSLSAVSRAIAANRYFFYTWCMVACIGLLGFGLRLYCLDCRGFWGDEINSLDGAALGIPAIFTERFGWVGNQTPLYYLILWLTVQPIDPTTTTVLVRLPSVVAGALLPSVVAGALTPLVVYGLGKEMFGRTQGVLAALMLALSAAYLNHSQELRLYAMMVFLTALSAYSLLLAERTGSGKWWGAFALSTIANLANAYIALTVAMSALAPYLLWLLWCLRRQKTGSKDRRPILYTTMSILAVGLASGIMLLDMLHAPRPSPDLSQLSFSGALHSVVELTTWFTRFGISEQLERPLQLILLLIATFGAYKALRTGRAISAYLCGLFVLVPPLILMVLGTTNVVFQRYALFAMPFYFLLISNGLVQAISRKGHASNATLANRAVRTASIAPTAITIAAFVIGAYNYFSPEGHLPLSYRPDFRGASRYLSQQVKERDIIVFVDDPGLGDTISNYYWKGSPPVPAYDARDPRLFSRAVQGDVYWVVSMENLETLAHLSAPDQGWSQVTRFELVDVLREQHSGLSIVDSMDHMVSKLEAISPNFQPASTLRGCVYQARGDTTRAVNAYRAAGIYFPVGDDYLRTAKGFDRLGDHAKAWREAFISKFWQPGNPDVHVWLAEALQREGYNSESRSEAQITGALRNTL